MSASFGASLRITWNIIAIEQLCRTLSASYFYSWRQFFPSAWPVTIFGVQSNVAAFMVVPC